MALSLFYKSRYNLFLTICYIIVVLLLAAGRSIYYDHTLQTQQQEAYAAAAATIQKDVALLIEEKKNATRVIGVTLSRNPAIKEALLRHDPALIDLQSISQELRQSSSFKNVWLHVVDEKGRSFKRSWSPLWGDSLLEVRKDLVQILRDPQIVSVISTGKFDMTFKTIVPIYEAEVNIGLLEIITHFNSIDRLLQERGLRSLVLVDRVYRQQITHPFTKKFVGEYYVANLDADPELMRIAEPLMANLLEHREDYLIDTTSGLLFSIHSIPDIQNFPMGYYITAIPLSSISLNHGDTLRLQTWIYFLVSLTFLTLLFYWMLDRSVYSESLATRSSVYRLMVILLFVYLLLIGVIYLLSMLQREQLINERIAEKTRDNQIVYQMAYSKYQDIADTIFKTLIRQDEVLSLVAVASKVEGHSRDVLRNRLYQLLLKPYEQIKEHGVRQLHFHLKNNESLLRFHRPQKYGDNLTDIRPTVRTVNTTLQSVHGFEEGRIYNGYRFVYPLFSKINEHIGSVEISFSTYAVLQEFECLEQLRTDVLFDRETVESKVFDDEKSNYVKSPFKGFYFERTIAAKTRGSFSDATYRDEALRLDIEEKIRHGVIFTHYADDTRQLRTFIPVTNPITKKVVACLVIDQHDTLIAAARFNAWVFFAGLSLLVGVIMIFIYRELLQKHISKTMNRILDQKVSYDTLTGAYSREYFNKTVAATLQEHMRKQRQSAIVMLDIDYFKRINDTFGHDIGDAVLKELVTFIKSMSREGDALIRWGGEEFVMLLETPDLDRAEKMVEKLRQAIASHPFDAIKALTCSFGMTLFEKDDTIESALKRADMALYDAKASGRNCLRTS